MSATERAECALTVDNQNIIINNEDLNHLYIEKILARRYNHNKKQYEYLLKFEGKDVKANTNCGVRLVGDISHPTFQSRSSFLVTEPGDKDSYCDENMWLPAYKLKLVCCLKHRCVKWKSMKKKLNSCTSQSWFSELDFVNINRKNSHHSKQVIKNRRSLCNGDDDSMHLSARKYQKNEFGSRKNVYHDKNLSIDGNQTQQQKRYWH